MKPARYAVPQKARRIIANLILAIAVLLFVALFATLVIRSHTAFSRFHRIEFCALCGMQQSYRETCLLDYRVLRATVHMENGISKIFRSTKKDCGHNFHTVYERMFHVALQRTPMRYRREFGTDHGADVFSHPAYIAALGSIHSTNPKSAQLIWHRTLRHFIEDHTNAIAQIRANLQHQNIDSTKNFLLTNRHFRPVRPNPERWFYALPNM